MIVRLGAAISADRDAQLNFYLSHALPFEFTHKQYCQSHGFGPTSKS